jgi:curved DNA-binding protein CbpA
LKHYNAKIINTSRSQVGDIYRLRKEWSTKEVAQRNKKSRLFFNSLLLAEGYTKMVVDPYKTLGLPHEASPYDIKCAYRKLALRLHPDRLTRMKASPKEMKEATKMFSEISGAYGLLSDEKRKRDYDHIYKFGGFDEETKKDASQTSTNPTKRVPQKGIGYAVCDPIKYILSQGKIRATTSAGIQIPSRFSFSSNQPGAGFRVAFSNSEIRESSSGTLKCTSKTTQFVHGKQCSRVETTTVHKDGRKETLIQGDDYTERKFSAAPKRKRRPSQEEDDLTHNGDSLPWYTNRWNQLTDKLQMCYNPCGAIQV